METLSLDCSHGVIKLVPQHFDALRVEVETAEGQWALGYDDPRIVIDKLLDAMSDQGGSLPLIGPHSMIYFRRRNDMTEVLAQDEYGKALCVMHLTDSNRQEWARKLQDAFGELSPKGIGLIDKIKKWFC